MSSDTNTESWTAFHWDSNNAWGLVSSREVWDHTVETVAKSKGKSFDEAERWMLDAKGFEGKEHWSFGYRREHSGEDDTLRRFFVSHGMLPSAGER